MRVGNLAIYIGAAFPVVVAPTPSTGVQPTSPLFTQFSAIIIAIQNFSPQMLVQSELIFPSIVPSNGSNGSAGNRATEWLQARGSITPPTGR